MTKIGRSSSLRDQLTRGPVGDAKRAIEWLCDFVVAVVDTAEVSDSPFDHLVLTGFPTGYTFAVGTDTWHSAETAATAFF